MAPIDVDFCFYDDPEVGGDPPDYVNSHDADRYSVRLRETHRDLWSKPLPNGEMLTLRPHGEGWLDVTSPSSLADVGFRLSSDTIATPHERYERHGMRKLWEALPADDRDNYKRRFYTIGGFVVFPRRLNSVNVSRGRLGWIQDRFDLTLECIRRYYLDQTDTSVNPLGAVLEADSIFFDLFGEGADGFASYIGFFHLDGLVRDGSVQMFDDFEEGLWHFTRPPLPTDATTYRRYLDNVLAFVEDRNARIKRATSPDA